MSFLFRGLSTHSVWPGWVGQVSDTLLIGKFTCCDCTWGAKFTSIGLKSIYIPTCHIFIYHSSICHLSIYIHLSIYMINYISMHLSTYFCHLSSLSICLSVYYVFAISYFLKRCLLSFFSIYQKITPMYLSIYHLSSTCLSSICLSDLSQFSAAKGLQ